VVQEKEKGLLKEIILDPSTLDIPDISLPRLLKEQEKEQYVWAPSSAHSVPSVVHAPSSLLS